MQGPRLLGALLGVMLLQPASAAVYSGFLDDPANLPLVASDLGLAGFGTPEDIANNVAIHGFSLIAAGSVSFTSTGFAAGGVDPYFTLFKGLGIGSAATFVASNYAHAFSAGGDFTFTNALAAGDYTLAIGAFANMSFAENYGSGSLDDGFTMLGLDDPSRTTFYAIDVTVGGITPPNPTPEPATGMLVGIALLGLLAKAGRRRGVPRQYLRGEA